MSQKDRIDELEARIDELGEPHLSRAQLNEVFDRLNKSLKAWLDVRVPQMVGDRIDQLREDNIKMEIIKKLVG